MTKDLKELAKTIRKDLQEVNVTAKRADDLQAQGPQAALGELNTVYCDLLSNQTHNMHVPKLVAMADTVIPVLDEYLQEYEQTAAAVQKMKGSMAGLEQLRGQLKKFQEQYAESQKPAGYALHV